MTTIVATSPKKYAKKVALKYQFILFRSFSCKLSHKKVLLVFFLFIWFIRSLVIGPIKSWVEEWIDRTFKTFLNNKLAYISTGTRKIIFQDDNVTECNSWKIQWNFRILDIKTQHQRDKDAGNDNVPESQHGKVLRGEAVFQEILWENNCTKEK